MLIVDKQEFQAQIFRFGGELVLKLFITIIFFLFLSVSLASATETKNVTIVNPIRGQDFWNYPHQILDTPKKQYELISRENLPATWLVRYDALTDLQVIQFLKSLNGQQEVGLFFEITPKFATDTGVKYNESPNWHYPRSIFLVGYSREEREKFINQAVKKYQEVFGKNPKSVGAWWIDAYSLSYLRDKYGIEANLDVADQFSTDQYQVWGQYFSLPFYPAKKNALMPAQSKDQKIGLVTIQWATRDPYNSYGSGVDSSTYSVQANDYLLHDLGIDYFAKLIDIYPQVTVGLENDFAWDEFGPEYQKQIELLVRRRQNGQLKLLTMKDFAVYYQQINPEVSPKVLISATDPLGGSGQVIWYQTPQYRVGWFYNRFGSVIADLRKFRSSGEESCYFKSCERLNLAFNFSEAIDEVNYNTHWLIDTGKISNLQTKQTKEGVRLSYQNQSGIERVVEFLDNDIKVDNNIKTLDAAILEILTGDKGTSGSKIGSEIVPQIDLVSNLRTVLPNLAKFIILTVFFFFIPGWLFCNNKLIAIPLGWSLFTLASFLLGFLKLDFLIWSIPLVSLVLLYKGVFPRPSFPKANRILLAIVILGSIMWILTTAKSGLLYNFGYGYWGPNGHDGIWHLALISELQRNTIPQNPVFAGEKLANYHYFFDLLLAKSGSLLQINNQDLLFRFFPLLISVLAGGLMYKVCEKLFSRVFSLSDQVSKSGALLATFWLYFGGSFGYIFTFLRERTWGGETLFWAQQGRSTLLNPPFAISIVLILSGLYLFYDVYNNQRLPKLKLLALALLWGSLIGFKAYGGVLILGALALLAAEKIVFKRDFRILTPLLGCFSVALTVFLPNNSASNSLFVTNPFWLVYSMVTFTDRLGWIRLSLAMQSEVLSKQLLSYIIGLVIFIVGNLGTRVLSLASWSFLLRERLLFYIALLGVVLSLIFVQKGTNWNVVQFFYYSILVGNIFAGLAAALIIQKLPLQVKYLFIALLVILTLPTSYSLWGEYVPLRAPAGLPKGEIEALNFLKTQSPGTVMTLSYEKNSKNKYETPIPLFAYESTSYVAAFSNHPTYLEDEVNLQILGVDFQGRLNEQRDFIRFPERLAEILKRNKINYVYLLKSSGLEIDESRTGIEKIFQNNDVAIFKSKT